MSFWTPQPRQPFIGLAVAAVLGVCAADRWETPPIWAFGFAALGVLAVLLRPAPMTCWFLCALTFFELHTVHHYDSEARQFARILANRAHVARATGIVWNEPEKSAPGTRTTTARF